MHRHLDAIDVYSPEGSVTTPNVPLFTSQVSYVAGTTRSGNVSFAGPPSVHLDGNELLLPYDKPLFEWLEAAGFAPQRDRRRLSEQLRANSAQGAGYVYTIAASGETVYGAVTFAGANQPIDTTNNRHVLTSVYQNGFGGFIQTGGMASLLPGHRDPRDPQDRADVARLWGVPELPAQRGYTAVEMFEAAARGEIKALWIACTTAAPGLSGRNCPSHTISSGSSGRATTPRSISRSRSRTRCAE